MEKVKEADEEAQPLAEHDRAERPTAGQAEVRRQARQTADARSPREDRRTSRNVLKTWKRKDSSKTRSKELREPRPTLRARRAADTAQRALELWDR